MLEEKSRALAASQASHESEVKQLRMELDGERGNLENMKLRLEGISRFLKIWSCYFIRILNV